MKMTDEQLVRLRAHSNNIHRYRRLLKGNLTEHERQFVERRLSLHFARRWRTLYLLPYRLCGGQHRKHNKSNGLSRENEVFRDHRLLAVLTR